MMSVAVTGHVAEWIKQELHALKQIDRRYTESRIVEESLAEYLPKLRARLRPDQAHPATMSHGGA